MRKYLLPILLLLPILAYGQKTNVHPIDKFLDACTDKDPSTAGVLKCTDAAYQK